jgi:hypothetical protein
MASDLLIQCICGALRGRAHGVSPTRGNRLVCYCRDCQSFAHFLGRPSDILDAHGGTDIFQLSPARIGFLAGADRLACMRLTETGMLRWYASCCRTPIGNTPANPKIPFVGLIHSCTDGAARGAARDALLGPVRARVYTRSAKGGRPPLAAGPAGTLRVILRFARLTLGSRLRGEHTRSPFFDASGQPRAQPKVLTAHELREVEERRDAA